jgi:hypothetical protein
MSPSGTDEGQTPNLQTVLKMQHTARQVNYEGNKFTTPNSYLLLKHILQHDICSTPVRTSVRPWKLFSSE